MKDVCVTIRVSIKEKEKIKQLAEEKDMSVSKFLYRNLVETILKED